MTVARNTKKRVQEFSDFIEDSKRKLENEFNVDHESYVFNMKKFWDDLARYYNEDKSKNDEVAKIFQSSENYLSYKRFFRRAQEIYERIVEIEDLQKVIKECIGIPLKKEHFINSIDTDFNKFTNDVISEELENIDEEFVKNSNLNSFVMVGCGPLAQTLLLFHFENPHIDCIGIDRDTTAIVEASKLLQRFEDLDKIKYNTLDGEMYDYKMAGIIFIANIVTPKNKVLNQIALTAKPGTKVVVRDPLGFSKIIFDDAEYRETKKLKIKNRYGTEKRYMHETIVLEVTE